MKSGEPCGEGSEGFGEHMKTLLSFQPVYHHETKKNEVQMAEDASLKNILPQLKQGQKQVFFSHINYTTSIELNLSICYNALI